MATTSMKRAAVLWTGGKDSCLALYRCLEMGFDVTALVTFIPKGGAQFKAHSTEAMIKHAEALAIPLHFIEVSEPFRDSYIAGLKWLKEQINVAVVVTGDIDLVAGLPNWICECCQNIGLDVIRPLWGESREVLLNELISRKIEARVSWINHTAIPKEWIGRMIDPALVRDLKSLAKSAAVDICGENGEYHTMVVRFPVPR